MESCYNSSKKLFLLKTSAGEISVPCGDLEQHQIDGVRFLFKQYKKMKPGVIMNYPSGCGNSVQTVKFLDAIQKELKKPVLILYDTEEEKETWVERFKNWTTIGIDKIAVDPPHSFIKRWIHIVQMANFNIFSRTWSIVVIKSDDPKKFKNIRYTLMSDFKIWITAIDMKKDNDMLFSIYTWMYTKSEAQIQKIMDNAKESYVNVLLDSFLEDVVLTRRDLKPFSSSKRQHETEIEIVTKVTKKNKDATGLKIKRSKKNPVSPSTSAVTGSVAVTLTSDIDTSVVSNTKVDIVKKANEDEEPKLDVESFIRDNEPLVSDCHFNMTIKSIDKAGEASAVNSSEANDLNTQSSLTIVGDNGAANNNDSRKDTTSRRCRNSLYSVELNNVNITSIISQRSVENENESKEPTFSNTKQLIKNVTISTEEEKVNTKTEFVKTDAGEKDNGQDSSDESIDVGRDQIEERKVELTTSVMQETDNSFDSKLKQMEERALKKFKGTFLDNIF